MEKAYFVSTMYRALDSIVFIFTFWHSKHEHHFFSYDYACKANPVSFSSDDRLLITLILTITIFFHHPDQHVMQEGVHLTVSCQLPTGNTCKGLLFQVCSSDKT